MTAVAVPDTTFDRVKQVVVNHLGCRDDLVKLDADFHGDLGADSLDDVELVMAIEEEFGIEISDDDAWECDTVGDLVKIVDKTMGAK